MRGSNPFARLLQPVGDCKLKDFPLRIVLPWKSELDHQAPLVECFGDAFQLVWTDLEVVALVGPATTTVLEPSSFVSLIFVTAGRVCLHQGDEHFCAMAGSCLIISGSSMRWISTSFSVVCVMIPSQRLTTLVALMQSDGSSHPHSTCVLDSPIPCNPSQGLLELHLLSLLDGTLRSISQLQESNPALVMHLGLAEQLSRLIAVLAFPSLRREEAIESLQPVHCLLQDSFDQLIDYISANLDQPLSLTILARRSSYSRRALQYIFRQRMGCTATQWIRARRLDLARQRLLTSSPGDSVTSIALACGYRSMGLFSIEFQQRFHIKPSHLLRSARSSFESPAQEP